MLDRLRTVNPHGAAWVEDVYSEVLRQLRRGFVKDELMLQWLRDSIEYHLGE